MVIMITVATKFRNAAAGSLRVSIIVTMATKFRNAAASALRVLITVTLTTLFHVMLLWVISEGGDKRSVWLFRLEDSC